ncbi:hypothetical protein K438DRAFT_1803833 [Mycena galopus ATCC 62051]|nr:hypothetical protein K438DRAFT_1803833 [Mycena galopus ATCC 62051]
MHCFGRISSRADSVSAFFKALCQRYRPPPPKAFVGDSDDQKQKTRPQSHTDVSLSPKDDSLVAEFESLLPKLVPKPLPEKLCGEVLQRAIYKPSGKWAFAAGLPFTECRPSVILSWYIGDRQCTLVSKMWLMKEKWHGFSLRCVLALYKLQLKSLQGRVVPAIINVFTCAGAVDKRCVQAFEKLHAVGPGARTQSAVGLAAATSDELRLEMRKIKFKLDYEDARAREDEKLMRAARLARRNQRGRKREEPLPEDVVDPPIDSRVWNLEWVGAPVEPDSTEDVEHAVEEFLGILERLEQEEKRTHRDGSMTRRRRASPDFKLPHSCLRNPEAITNFKLPALPPKSPGKPTTVTPTTLKRKGDCDRPHEAQNASAQIPLDVIYMPSPPPAHEHPPISTGPLPAPKVRDLVYEMPLRRCSTLPLQPQLTPTRSSAPRLDPSSSSPPSSAKRKRTTDAADEFLGGPPCDHAIPSSVVQSATVSTAVHDAEEVPPVLLPTPLLSRFVENMWRLVS